MDQLTVEQIIEFIDPKYPNFIERIQFEKIDGLCVRFLLESQVKEKFPLLRDQILFRKLKEGLLVLYENIDISVQDYPTFYGSISPPSKQLSNLTSSSSSLTPSSSSSSTPSSSSIKSPRSSPSGRDNTQLTPQSSKVNTSCMSQSFIRTRPIGGIKRPSAIEYFDEDEENEQADATILLSQSGSSEEESSWPSTFVFPKEKLKPTTRKACDDTTTTLRKDEVHEIATVLFNEMTKYVHTCQNKHYLMAINSIFADPWQHIGKKKGFSDEAIFHAKLKIMFRNYRRDDPVVSKLPKVLECKSKYTPKTKRKPALFK